MYDILGIYSTFLLSHATHCVMVYKIPLALGRTVLDVDVLDFPRIIQVLIAL